MLQKLSYSNSISSSYNLSFYLISFLWITTFFKHLNCYLTYKNLSNQDQIKKSFIEFINSLNEEFVNKRVDNLLPKWNKYIEAAKGNDHFFLCFYLFYSNKLTNAIIIFKTLYYLWKYFFSWDFKKNHFRPWTKWKKNGSPSNLKLSAIKTLAPIY